MYKENLVCKTENQKKKIKTRIPRNPLNKIFLVSHFSFVLGIRKKKSYREKTVKRQQTKLFDKRISMFGYCVLSVGQIQPNKKKKTAPLIKQLFDVFRIDVL